MKTKIYFGLIALAMLAMSSCTKEVTVDQVNPDTPIEFGTYLGRAAQTKGHITDLSDATYGIQTTGFGVYAYYTDQSNMTSSATPNYMANQLVEYQDSKWVYDPVKYWPNNNNDKVSFFAYAPYAATINTKNITSLPASTATGYPVIGFKVNETVTEQTDLLYATALENKSKPAKYTDKTTFAFNHALSRVAFSVQLMVDAVNGDATGGPDVAETPASGTLDHPNTTVAVTKVELIGKFHNSADLNLQNGAFSNFNTADAIYVLQSANFEDVAKSVTTEDTALNNGDSYIMIIPKNFADTDKVKIKVTYTVTTTDNKLDGSKSEITNIIESDAFNFNFEQGKAYNFSLHLGLDSVEFDASVADWTNGTQADTAVNVPINKN